MPQPTERRPAAAELDEITLRRAQRGDADALRALVERYERPVFALLGRMLGPVGRGDLTEDLAQETFLRCIRHLPRFDRAGAAKLSTWILTVATRLALDELRRHRPESIESAGPGNAAHSPIQAVERRLDTAAMHEAIAKLPHEARAALLLRIVHELPLRDIAAALEVEVGTVKSRLSRATAVLRNHLGEAR